MGRGRCTRSAVQHPPPHPVQRTRIRQGVLRPPACHLGDTLKTPLDARRFPLQAQAVERQNSSIEWRAVGG